MRRKNIPAIAAAGCAAVSSLGMTAIAILWPVLPLEPTIVVPSIVALAGGTVFFTICGAVLVVVDHDPSPASAPPTPVPFRLTPREHWVQRFSWSQKGRKPSTSTGSGNRRPSTSLNAPPSQATGPAQLLTITVTPPETTTPPETNAPPPRQTLRPLTPALNNQPQPASVGDFFYAASPASYVSSPLGPYQTDTAAATTPRKNS